MEPKGDDQDKRGGIPSDAPVGIVVIDKENVELEGDDQDKRRKLWRQEQVCG